MKRIIMILTLLLILTGCARQNTAPTEPDTTDPTAADSAVSWIEEIGQPWDAQGVLLELPLSIPGGWGYSSARGYDADLLLWSLDSHLENQSCMELCLIDLENGTISAQRDIPVQSYPVPQVLGDALYICDNLSGTVLQLDNRLQTVSQWQIEPGEGSWYMGAGNKLYISTADSRIRVRDLASGTEEPLIEGDPEGWIMYAEGACAFMEYYRTDTGAAVSAVLDLMTGEVLRPDIGVNYNSIDHSEGNWLCGGYSDGYSYYICPENAAPTQVDTGDTYLQLMDENLLLATDEMGMYLHLYDLQGHGISSCQLSENGNYYAGEFVYSKELNGYFFQLSNFEGSYRLMFWDLDRAVQTADLQLQPIPTASEAELAAKQRAEALSSKYGVSILVGDHCDTEFFDFSASITEDWTQTNTALDLLDDAFSDYPEGFFRQLRYGEVRGIEIHLVQDLQAFGFGRDGGDYAAFVYPEWDRTLMVVDIYECGESTYYHEMSHVIDSYLDWDATQRDDSLYSEEAWADLNPDWFWDYSYDYSVEAYLDDYESFIDGYSTIKPTEDRARVMEYAMSDFGIWSFDGAEVLLEKLDYYCRCIRDAFDTTGWPETTLWEQYLYLKD